MARCAGRRMMSPPMLVGQKYVWESGVHDPPFDLLRSAQALTCCVTASRCAGLTHLRWEAGDATFAGQVPVVARVVDHEAKGIGPLWTS